MKKKYYIYHIPTYTQHNGSVGKIGCSHQPKYRVKQQGYTEYEILEVYDSLEIASKREIELQIEYGYLKDSAPYSNIVNAQKLGSIIGNNKKNRLKANKSRTKTLITNGTFKGEKNPRAKLTLEQVKEIRRLYNSKEITNKAELGRMFEVTDSMIRYVVQNKSWVL